MTQVKKNMKIALYLPSLEGGGAERVVVNLANEFVRRRINVDLVLVSKSGLFLREVLERVNIINLKKSRALFSIFSLVRYIQKERPDVVLSTLNHTNTIAILANKIAGVNCGSVVRVPCYFSLVERGYKKLLARMLYPKSNMIIAISEDIKKDLVKTLNIPEKNIEVVYNPIFDESIIEKARQEVDHPFFKNKHDKIILGVGSLTAIKDFRTLIKAFYELNKRVEQTKLIILGEGEERSDLERSIMEFNLKERVSLPGFVNNPYAYMAKSDVFVLSSLSEGFGNVIVEAMACGTSIVSVDCPGGPVEILEQGKYGRLVQSGSATAITKAIEEVLDSPFDPVSLKKRATDFDIEKMANRYLEVMFSK